MAKQSAAHPPASAGPQLPPEALSGGGVNEGPTTKERAASKKTKVNSAPKMDKEYDSFLPSRWKLPSGNIRTDR